MAERLGRIEVSIDGKPEQEVLRLNVETVTPIDYKGAPQGQPLFRRIVFTTRVMQGLYDAVAWTINEPRSAHNLRNGVINFYDSEGQQYQTLEWSDGFVERADWVLPDTEKDEQQRVLMEYQIVAGKATIGGIELVNPWTRNV